MNLLKKIIKSNKKIIFQKCFFTLISIIIGMSISLKNKETKIWLIGETDISAQDNGYHFFRFIRKNYPDKKCYYLINKKSKDRKKIEKLGNIIYHNTLKHFLYLFLAEKHIGTHDYRYWHYPGYSKLFNKLFKSKLKGKFIQLQHGIIHIKSERGFHYDKHKPYDMVCVSSKYEKELLINHFSHKESVIKITGLCRYDNLENKKKNYKQILLIPTWRKDLLIKEKFKKSEYLKRITEILTDKETLNMLRLNKIKLNVYLHIKLQNYTELLKKNENENINIVEFGEKSVQDLISENDLMITDYSSVSLDFAYLKKPVIFYQWDFNEYIKSYDVKNYLEYKQMRFGYICKKKSELLEKLSGYINNGFEVKKEHKEKSEVYFKYNDKKNCERVLKEIERL